MTTKEIDKAVAGLLGSPGFVQERECREAARSVEQGLREQFWAKFLEHISASTDGHALYERLRERMTE